MIARISSVLVVASMLTLPFLSGCETSHTETTRHNLLGGQTHEETTVYKNIDGSTSVDHEKQVTR
jgi:hypothetical protein